MVGWLPNPSKHNGNQDDVKTPLIEEEVPLSDGTPVVDGTPAAKSPNRTQHKKRQKISAAGVASVVAEALSTVPHSSPL